MTTTDARTDAAPERPAEPPKDPAPADLPPASQAPASPPPRTSAPASSHLPSIIVGIVLAAVAGLSIWYLTTFLQRLWLRRWHESELQREN